MRLRKQRKKALHVQASSLYSTTRAMKRALDHDLRQRHLHNTPLKYAYSEVEFHKTFDTKDKVRIVRTIEESICYPKEGCAESQRVPLKWENCTFELPLFLSRKWREQSERNKTYTGT